MSLLDAVRGTAETIRGVITDPDEREEFKEKVKDLPLYALQTALSGVGQALLFADRCRTAIQQLTGSTEESERAAAGEPARRRPPTMYTSEPNGDRERPPAEEPVRRAPVIYTPAKDTQPAKEAKEAKPRPPIPNYDELTVPSLRARLRGLSAEQVAELRDYEKATLAREDVVRMYENRLVKLANLPKPRQ